MAFATDTREDILMAFATDTREDILRAADICLTTAERAKGQAWGLKTIESFHTHGTPPVA
jgi:hypothetical protein